MKKHTATSCGCGRSSWQGDSAADCHVSWQTQFGVEILLPSQQDGHSRFRLRLAAASSPNFDLMDAPWMRMRSWICYVLFLQTIPNKVMPFPCGTRQQNAIKIFHKIGIDVGIPEWHELHPGRKKWPWKSSLILSYFFIQILPASEFGIQNLGPDFLWQWFLQLRMGWHNWGIKTCIEVWDNLDSAQNPRVQPTSLQIISSDQPCLPGLLSSGWGKKGQHLGGQMGDRAR